jgi:hypothetical protein
MEYFTESEVDLMCEHSLSEWIIIYLRVARRELPCRRKDFLYECREVDMTPETFRWVTNNLSKRGWINSPRNISEIMNLTKKGEMITESMGEGCKYKRFDYRKEWYNLDVLMQLGQVKARKMNANSRYYEKI